MARQWIKELQIGQSVQLEVCIHRSEVYKTRYGEDYLSLTLGDRTGKIAAKRFGPSPPECEALASIRFARIRGQVELFGERRQVRLTRPLENLGTPEDLQDFFVSAP